MQRREEAKGRWLAGVSQINNPQPLCVRRYRLTTNPRVATPSHTHTHTSLSRRTHVVVLLTSSSAFCFFVFLLILSFFYYTSFYCSTLTTALYPCSYHFIKKYYTHVGIHVLTIKQPSLTQIIIITTVCPLSQFLVLNQFSVSTFRKRNCCRGHDARYNDHKAIEQAIKSRASHSFRNCRNRPLQTFVVQFATLSFSKLLSRNRHQPMAVYVQ